MTRRVLVAGMGDSGLLVARHLSRHRDVEVVGVSSKPGMVSGQELGVRLARPDEWATDYVVPFARFRRLDDVRTVHGTLTGLDLNDRSVTVVLPDGTETAEPYDTLVIATGVTNGFWREPSLQTADDVAKGLRSAHERIAAAPSVAVLGGGAAAVGSAVSIAQRWPDKQVDLYFPGERALPQHHWDVWGHVSRRLERLGVGLHPGHRAVVPGGFEAGALTDGQVTWSTGQDAAAADVVLWAIGRVRPNTGWLPPALLDDDGFVLADRHLRVPGQPDVFAIGDVASTDPQRRSARDRADRLLAHNIRADAVGKPLRTFEPKPRRWGSVLGSQPDGLEIFFPGGQRMNFPHWSNVHVVRPWFVRRGIYGGVRR